MFDAFSVSDQFARLDIDTQVWDAANEPSGYVVAVYSDSGDLVSIVRESREYKPAAVANYINFTAADNDQDPDTVQVIVEDAESLPSAVANVISFFYEEVL